MEFVRRSLVIDKRFVSIMDTLVSPDPIVENMNAPSRELVHHIPQREDDSIHKLRFFVK